MSRSHKKYLREQKAKDDKQQATFDQYAKIKPTKEQQAKAVFTLETDKQVMCAYCLYQDKLYKFLISTKKGFHKSQAICPDCKNKQLIRTLTAEMNAEQYAEWMYLNMAYGGWQKVPWTKWKERLAQIGWSQPFWNRYKALKGEEGEQETYEGTLNRQYEEYIKEHGEEE